MVFFPFGGFGWVCLVVFRLLFILKLSGKCFTKNVQSFFLRHLQCMFCFLRVVFVFCAFLSSCFWLHISFFFFSVCVFVFLCLCLFLSLCVSFLIVRVFVFLLCLLFVDLCFVAIVADG